MSVAKRLLLILSVVVCCAGCDRLSKTYAEARLSSTQTLSFLAGSLRLQLSHNEGAFLSLGASLPKPWREALFRGGVACMLAGLLAYAVFFAPPALGRSLARASSLRAERAISPTGCCTTVTSWISSISASARFAPASSMSPTWPSRREFFCLSLYGHCVAMQSTSMSNDPGKAATHRKMRAGEPAGK
jgi:hypothetical protein